MLKNKIISSDKDLIGLVFFGTVSIMFAFTVSIKAKSLFTVFHVQEQNLGNHLVCFCHLYCRLNWISGQNLMVSSQVDFKPI